MIELERNPHYFKKGLPHVDEFSYLLSVADRPAKACVPGPFTLSGRLDGGTVYGDRLGRKTVPHDSPALAVWSGRTHDLDARASRAS